MDSRNGKLWFRAKRFGFGWRSPVCWQGWAVYGFFFALLVVGSVVLLSEETALHYVLYVLMLAIALTFVCWKKGGTPRWRWGTNDSEETDH